MKKLVRSLAFALPVTLLVAGCKDDFDFGTGIGLDFREGITITAKFENADGLATIESLEVSLDDLSLHQRAPSKPVAELIVTGTRYGSPRGNHRLSFRIADQTSSPNTYRVTELKIIELDENGATNRTLQLEPRTASLQTNAVITYDFRL